MKMAFDTFTYITVENPETVETLRKKYPRFKLDKDLTQLGTRRDDNRWIANPAVDDRKRHINDNKMLYKAFSELDRISGAEPYEGQGLDQLTLGLIGYIVPVRKPLIFIGERPSTVSRLVH